MKTFYEVSELVGVVEVCTVVFIPNVTECPIQSSFNIMFSTTDNTAGSVMLYIIMQALIFFCTIPSCYNGLWCCIHYLEV